MNAIERRSPVEVFGAVATTILAALTTVLGLIAVTSPASMPGVALGGAIAFWSFIAQSAFAPATAEFTTTALDAQLGGMIVVVQGVVLFAVEVVSR